MAEGVRADRPGPRSPRSWPSFRPNGPRRNVSAGKPWNARSKSCDPGWTRRARRWERTTQSRGRGVAGGSGGEPEPSCDFDRNWVSTKTQRRTKPAVNRHHGLSVSRAKKSCQASTGIRTHIVHRVRFQSAG